MTNKHKTIKRIELMGGLLPKEMGMSRHKEQVREKNIYELALKIADLTVTTGKVSSRSLAEALYDVGYRLQPTLDVDSNKIIPDLRQWLIDRSGLSAGTELYSTYRGVFIDFRKDVVQQIKEMMEGK